MEISISKDQASMKNMEINLSELNSALMPELTDSAILLSNSLPEKDKPY
ncbi:MAG: hypothetical protein N4R20_01765 [Lactobacillus iners]|nr:hypothetical protein [Lactobacillus iners]MCT7669138.1 hypothetical protein [Lactobacillus iners]MCT7692869.1 hypothetical protein [Lactobacillus iners]MCT7778026.1 hypothetical protein [Lactobacillus iners]MCT7893796.1 hypothetical protein [Lactobacillus iners]MDK8756749.1 hypothetical protein [Lactobacillus iners]